MSREAFDGVHMLQHADEVVRPRMGADHPRGPFDGVHRGAEIMADFGQEGALGVLRLLRRLGARREREHEVAPAPLHRPAESIGAGEADEAQTQHRQQRIQNSAEGGSRQRRPGDPRRRHGQARRHRPRRARKGPERRDGEREGGEDAGLQHRGAGPSHQRRSRQKRVQRRRDDQRAAQQRAVSRPDDVSHPGGRDAEDDVSPVDPAAGVGVSPQQRAPLDLADPLHPNEV